jgi:hypothetical protein
MRRSKRSNFRKKTLLSSRFNFLFSRKTFQSNLSWLKRALSSSVTHKERLSGHISSLTSESESEMFLEDLPMRKRSVKSSGLRLTFSSSSELEESTLEKSKSLRPTHTWDMIFWNFFLSPKRYFFLSSPFLLKSFRLLLLLSYLLEESSFFLLGQSAMKWMVSPHLKQLLGDLLISLWNLCKAQNFLISRVISSLGMLSYYSSKVAAKENRANSKADEIVVLVGLASWPPTQALVIKALLEREPS